MPRELINGYIARFGREREIEYEPLNAEGFTTIARGSATVRVNLLDDQGVILLLAPVMPVPEKNTEDFYRRLLELSFLATSDAAFAIDKKTDTVYLRALRRIEGLDYEEFEDLLHTVASVADAWDDKLRGQFGG
jgi:hypothetical protein